MNGLVIGLGSMGMRRIRLMHKYFADAKLCGADSNPDRRRRCEEEFAMPAYASISEAVAAVKPQFALVCTSPLSHSAIIGECLKNGMDVFTELNLVKDGYEENMALAKENGKTLFLSSTALYRREMRYVIDAVAASNTPVSYMYHVGQYLPDWHPWESFNSFFIGDRRTNGCREILAIELPWITAAFGEITSVNAVTTKLTSLNIDYDDTYLIELGHGSGAKGLLAVDVVCREAVRNLEVFGEELYISWRGKPESLMVKKPGGLLEQVKLYESVEHLDGYSATIIENQYLDELREFFAVLGGKTPPRYGFAEDLATIKVIDGIEGIA